MTTHQLLGYGLALLPIVLTPGASFTLVTSRALRSDHRGARHILSGTALGILTHALLAGLGLAAVARPPGPSSLLTAVLGW